MLQRLPVSTAVNHVRLLSLEAEAAYYTHI
jgi:hypothetical protein